MSFNRICSTVLIHRCIKSEHRQVTIFLIKHTTAKDILGPCMKKRRGGKKTVSPTANKLEDDRANSGNDKMSSSTPNTRCAVNFGK